MEDDPFSFEGPEIYKCKGCTIDWKKGKNLTVKQVKKKQKHKNKGSVRTITKQVKADSFFNFFDPPAVPDDPSAQGGALLHRGGLGGRERRRGGGVRRGRGRR